MLPAASAEGCFLLMVHLVLLLHVCLCLTDTLVCLRVSLFADALLLCLNIQSCILHAFVEGALCCICDRLDSICVMFVCAGPLLLPCFCIIAPIPALDRAGGVWTWVSVPACDVCVPWRVVPAAICAEQGRLPTVPLYFPQQQPVGPPCISCYMAQPCSDLT